MTNLAICSKCYALTPDTDEAVAIHRRKAHTEPAADIERARSAASAAETELKLLRATVRDYEKSLEQRPVPVEPEISMRVVEDDEIDDGPDDTVSPETVEEANLASAASYEDVVAAFALAPQIDPSGLYPSIDRPDEPLNPYGPNGTAF